MGSLRLSARCVQLHLASGRHGTASMKTLPLAAATVESIPLASNHHRNAVLASSWRSNFKRPLV